MNMKILNLTCFVFFFILFTACGGDKSNNQTGSEFNINNPATADSKSKGKNLQPEISFDNTEYNFGTLIQGEKVAHNFTFTNTGKGNLVISNVSASCGCTTPAWSREPIPPGGTGFIEVVFDSRGREGRQTKTIKVFSNTQPSVTDLTVRCDIVY